MAGNLNKVKVLVVGDSGVGKTSLVNLICYEESLSNPAWTIGCSVELKLHEYHQGRSDQRDFIVELWDIGGSANHRCSRTIFYNAINGLILVYDLTNHKSYLNLRKWLSEVLNAGKDTSSITGKKLSKTSVVIDFENEEDYDLEQFIDNQIPILIVGAKMDQCSSLRTNGSIHGVNLAEEVGAESITLDCTKVDEFSSVTSQNVKKLNTFFDKVIERRYYSREIHQTNFHDSSARVDNWKERASKRKVF